MKQDVQSNIWSWVKALLFSLAIAFVIRNFIFSPFVVEGASMYPTLSNGEKLLVNKIPSINDDYKRGDIIILSSNKTDEYYVKRIIGLPGDTIRVKNDVLYVNGQSQKENYLVRKKKLPFGRINFTDDFPQVKVPKGQVFVMGDNRPYSRDSRNGLGYFSEDCIIGKVEGVFSPLSHLRHPE